MWRAISGVTLLLSLAILSYQAGTRQQQPPVPVTIRPAVSSIAFATDISRGPPPRVVDDNATADQVSESAVRTISSLEPRERRRVLARLACSIGAAGDAVLHAACLGGTPSLGTLRRVASALNSPSRHRAVTTRAATTTTAAAAVATARHARIKLPHGDDSPKWWAVAAADPTSFTIAPRQRALLLPPPPPSPLPAVVASRSVPAHLQDNPAPRWLDRVRPIAQDWQDLKLQQWELMPLLKPRVARHELPACVWERLATLCAKVGPAQHPNGCFVPLMCRRSRSLMLVWCLFALMPSDLSQQCNQPRGGAVARRVEARRALPPRLGHHAHRRIGGGCDEADTHGSRECYLARGSLRRGVCVLEPVYYLD